MDAVLVMFLVVAYWLCPVLQDIPQDADSFLRRMETSFDSIYDLEYEFESTVQSVRREVQLPPQSIRGTYRYRKDAGERVEYNVVRGDESSSALDIAVGTRGGIQKSRYQQRGGSGSGFVSKSGWINLDAPGLPGRILYLGFFQEYASHIRASFRAGGWESLEGHRCLKVSFDLVPVTDGFHATHTFWIDIARGSHPVRHDYTQGGKLTLRATIELAAFKGGDGQELFVPVKGSVASHLARIDGEVRHLRDPAITEEIRLIPQTVKLNSVLDEGKLDVQFQKGDFVKDRVAGATYRFAESDEPPMRLTGLTPDEAAAALERGIDEADSQLDPLVARSRARTLFGPGASGVTQLAWQHP